MEKGRLVVTKQKDVFCYGYFSGEVPVELYVEREEARQEVGNILTARIERVSPDLHSAFVDMGSFGKGYLTLYPDRQGSGILNTSGAGQETLKGGDLVLVQILREGTRTKLPKVTGDLSLAGTFAVLSADPRIGVSKKIRDTKERARLKKIAESLHTGETGIVLRTNAQGMPEEVLTLEIRRLQDRWKAVLQKASCSGQGSLLYREPPHYCTLLRELDRKELSEIVTDDQTTADVLEAYTTLPVRRYADSYPLYKLYRFDHHYEQALRKTVWLKSGGFLVVEPTEAMVVVDVNSGSVIKSRNARQELAFEVNLEAASEILRQLRLRNLSGIIVVDFINMKKGKSMNKLMDFLEQEAEKDRLRVRVVDMTALGLVEITREKRRKPLRDQILEAGLTFPAGSPSEVPF